jgi:hypothetical protein
MNYYWLNRIQSALRRYGRDLQPPCSDEALKVARDGIWNALGMQIPDDYCRFLRRTDGMEWNGVCFYGACATPLVGAETHKTREIVAENVDLHSLFPDYRGVLVLGDSSMDHYLFYSETSEFVVKAAGSADVFVRSPRFEPVFEYAARTALGIPKRRGLEDI